MTSSALPPGLQVQLERTFRVKFGPATEQLRGEESVGWRVPSSAGEMFIQLYPNWRTVGEVEWCYQVARAAAADAPEVALPLVGRDGAIALATPGGPVSVFPFVFGTPLETESATLRIAAAELLARLHRGMARGPLVQSARPPSGPDAPGGLRSFTAVKELPDPDLDLWEEGLSEAGFATGLVHGDFYRANVVCTDTRIVGVIDWLEAEHEFLCQELGWSIWEFSQNDRGDDLIDERANAFLAAYLRAGGPVPPRDLRDLVLFIRRRLRQEVGRERLTAARGRPFDPEYVNSEVRAFKTLRERTIDLPD
jgi:Ser/Thr protein kinase RdoA (MazF antagonist)